ncbi:MAG: DUF192 domain-containing protein [Fimbriimonadaceae bacterium]
MRRHARALLVGALAVVGCNHAAPSVAAKPATPTPAAHDPGDYSSLRKYPLKSLLQSSVKVNGKEIPVWVMDTESKRAEGFMYLRRRDVPDGHGMIFMFPATIKDYVTHGFWMQNCLLELDIAFIGPNKKVLNVARGKKLDETDLPAGGPYKYVLELKAGDAAVFGVKPGVQINIPSHLETKT